MGRRKTFFRWLSGWLLLSMLGVGILGGAGLSVRAAPVQQASMEVVISEVAWAGTQAYFGDEWIELYYPPGAGPDPLSLNGWILTNDTEDFYISFDAGDEIFQGSFFLIERGSGNATSEPQQKTYTSGSLSDDGDTLYLLDDTRAVIDIANSSGSNWPAGSTVNYSSMERVIESGVPRTDGKYAWITNDGTLKNGLDAAGNDIFGTPGQDNWSFSVTPTATSTITPFPTPTLTPAPVNPLTVVINEVAWAGTAADADDEWIELYNTSSSNINLSGWSLYINSSRIDLSGIINKNSYFLLERTDDETLPTIDADFLYTGSLSNFGAVLRLYDPNNNLVDSANSNSSFWPAGSSSTYSSMERSLIATDSDYTWVTYNPANDNVAEADRDEDAEENIIKGTPRRANSQLNVTPTPTPRTSTGGSSSGSSGGTPVKPLLGISEFLPRPGYDWNNDGTVDVFDEFIEIINAGTISVNLSAYRIDDEEIGGSAPFTLPDVTLQPGERAVFYASQSGILLSDAGDTVRLLRGSTVEDAYTYSVVGYPDQAWCRLPDRLGYWNDPCFPTPNNPNSLTGTTPLPSGPAAGYQPPICLLPDTTPDEFVYAECEVGGDEIFNRQYWDKADDSKHLKLDEAQKWETVFE